MNSVPSASSVTIFFHRMDQPPSDNACATALALAHAAGDTRTALAPGGVIKQATQQ